jgi:hypothetical protein
MLLTNRAPTSSGLTGRESRAGLANGSVEEVRSIPGGSKSSRRPSGASPDSTRERSGFRVPSTRPAAGRLSECSIAVMDGRLPIMRRAKSRGARSAPRPLIRTIQENAPRVPDRPICANLANIFPGSPDLEFSSPLGRATPDRDRVVAGVACPGGLQIPGLFPGGRHASPREAAVGDSRTAAPTQRHRAAIRVRGSLRPTRGIPTYQEAWGRAI